MRRISNLDSTEQTPAWLLQMRLDGGSYIEVSTGSIPIFYILMTELSNFIVSS